MTVDIKYSATPTAGAFHASDAWVKGIIGPVGAGKTVACVMDMLRLMLSQPANDKGVRQTRFVAIRQNYPMLMSTVIKTFEDWLGPLGKMTFGVPITWRAKFPAPDGTTVQTEVMFLALERPEDAAKLRSLEVSHGYISEFAEIPSEIMEMLRGRIGRFPSKRHGAECHKPTIILESNPPSVRSHWYKLFEEVKPKGFELFRQPAPLFYDPDAGGYHDPDAYTPNPAAENIQYLPGGYDYYLNQIAGADRSYINVYIMGEYGATFSGERIFDQYVDAEHCAPHILAPVAKSTLVCGIDFGLNAAVVITELAPTGALRVLDEVCGQDVMLEEFLENEVRPLLFQNFKGWPVQFVGDPSDNTGKAGYTLLHRMGWAATPSHTNDPVARWDAVKFFLSRRNGFIMSPSCSTLREGFLGGYHYKNSTASSLRHTGRADKNYTSHPHDALGYAALEYRRIAQKRARPQSNKPRRRHLWA